MDVVSYVDLLQIVFAYAAIISGVVWAITEKLKTVLFHTDEARTTYTPYLALGVSILVAFGVWAALGDFRIEPLATYLLGGLFTVAGSEYIHQRIKPKEDVSSKL